MRRGDLIEVEATDLDEAGSGVADAGGAVVHAAGLLPGERGQVAVDHVSPHRAEAWGTCRRRGSDSPDRVEPACPAFGRCGGCAWQHLAYPAQLAAKHRRVARALAAAAVAPDAIDPVVPAPRQLGYRTKGKYVIGEAGGDLVLGAFEPRTHRLVDTAGCRQVVGAVDRAAAAVRASIAGSGVPAYDEGRRDGAWRYAVIRAGETGAAVAHLVTTTAAARADIDAVAARAVAGGDVAGVTWSAHDRTSGAILGGDVVAVAGRATVAETFAGVTLDVDATAFVQVNREQARRIYRDLAGATGAGAGTRAVDLYCGIGGIALHLAARGADVVGVESHPASVAIASAAAAPNTRFVCARAADVPGAAGGAVDVVAVNPPRKGLDAATRRAVLELAPATLAYLSCGPASLARDLVELTGAGYRVDLVRPYDLMPGTAQVETLVILRASRP